MAVNEADHVLGIIELLGLPWLVSAQAQCAREFALQHQAGGLPHGGKWFPCRAHPAILDRIGRLRNLAIESVTGKISLRKMI